MIAIIFLLYGGVGSAALSVVHTCDGDPETKDCGGDRNHNHSHVDPFQIDAS
jgi:hypothetical protein